MKQVLHNYSNFLIVKIKNRFFQILKYLKSTIQNQLLPPPKIISPPTINGALSEHRNKTYTNYPNN